MEADILAVVQPLQLVAHVLEQQPVLLGVDLEAALQQPQDELDPPHGDHAALVHVHDVPRVLEEGINRSYFYKNAKV